MSRVQFVGYVTELPPPVAVTIRPAQPSVPNWKDIIARASATWNDKPRGYVYPRNAVSGASG